MSSTFTVRQVSELFGIPQRRLRYWCQTGFIIPSDGAPDRLLYSFRDLVGIKVAKGLLDGGLPLRRVRRSLAALARSLPEQDTSLATLRIRCEGDAVVVEQSGRHFEPDTGQFVLDFDLEALREDASQVLCLPWVSEEPAAELHTAYDWFLHACELEDEWDGAPSDTEGFEAAKQAYEQALQLDPEMSAAWTNLGSMLADIGDLDGAREHYERAIAIDPDQPEAHCNLADLILRDGDAEASVALYRRVVQLAPSWPEAHYGLARALLVVGGRAQALAHLERFCAVVDGRSTEMSNELKRRRERTQAVVEALRAEFQGE